MADRHGDYLTPRLARWRRWTDGPLLVIAIGSLPFLLLELRQSELSDFDAQLVRVVNIVVLIVFLVDYIVELTLARRRAAFVRSQWSSLLIVVSQAVALIPGLGAFGVVRSVRGLRLVRVIVVVVRLFAIGGATAREGRAYLRRHAAGLALAVAGLSWLTSAAAFMLVEGPRDDRELYAFGDALWWSTSTITTVGYGVLSPTTGAGRLVGGFTMLVGISAFAVVTAKIAEWLVRDGDDRPHPTSEELEQLVDAA